MTSKMKNCRFVLLLTIALLMPWNASAQRLNRKKAALVAQEVLKEWKNETAAQWRAVWDSRNLTIGGRTMPFHVQLFGLFSVKLPEILVIFLFEGGQFCFFVFQINPVVFFFILHTSFLF